jgi:hypothetical protein
MKVQTKLPQKEVAAKLLQLGPWFYPFEFQNGARAEVQDESALSIHQSRAQGGFSNIGPPFPRSLGEYLLPLILPVMKDGSACRSHSVAHSELKESMLARSESRKRILFRDAAEFANATYEVGDLV